MDRREFFRRGVSKAAEVAIKQADERVAERAKHWIRPPYALPELEFLLACTRCNACIEACPHTVIFPLAARLGADVVNTPALDLLNKACHLCEDWPCVKSCEPAALKIPEEDVVLPKLASISIDETSCLPFMGPECGACADSCPVPNALNWNDNRPVIDKALCTGCGLCRQACILDPRAISIAVIASD